MKKYLFSLTMILSLLMCSLCFAQAQEFAAPGIDGPVINAPDNDSNVINTVGQNVTNPSAAEDAKAAQLEALRARLAELRGEAPSQINSTAATGNVVVNNVASGYTSRGVAYGFARLAQNISAKRGETTFISATYTGNNRYEVVNKSTDWWANGTFIVDVFGANENSLKEGYQIWFALYDANLNRIGTAQAKRK